MLSLLDIVSRSHPATPWSEGDNIPWDDPEFSRRMLAEHLSQDHDLASRRTVKIDEQIARLAHDLPAPPARILDLACGPGLYLSRLADMGYRGSGIDFSPASIEFARSRSGDRDLEYRLADLRTADFGAGFDAVLLLYGQVNVFRREQAHSLLAKAHDALVPGGVIVLEPQTSAHIRDSGQAPPSWSSEDSGLFAARPHVLLTESFWDEASATATQRFFTIDAATGEVTRHALSSVAYTEAELTAMLGEAGFVDVEHRPSLAGGDAADGLSAVVAARGE